MKRILAFTFIGMATCAVGDDKLPTQDTTPTVTNERPMSFWMAQKIEYSKRILEALTKEDFAKVEAEAKQLRTLGKIEGFVRRKDPTYTRHQQSFDSSLVEIAAQAQEQNVEGAVLAFNQLTTSCIACHKTLRAPTVASKDAVPVGAPSATREAAK